MSSRLDSNQIIQKIFDDSSQGIKVAPTGNLVNEQFDYIDITNSVIDGKTVPTSIVYKLGGPTGTTVATLTLTYDSSANLLTVSKS